MLVVWRSHLTLLGRCIEGASSLTPDNRRPMKTICKKRAIHKRLYLGLQKIIDACSKGGAPCSLLGAFSWGAIYLDPCSMGRKLTKMRSTIKVHPDFSEAPHFRSSIPHQNPDYSNIPMASRRMIFPMAQVYKRVSFRNKNGIPTVLG